MKLALWLATAVLALSACSMVDIKVQDLKGSTDRRIKSVAVDQHLCDVTRELALYVDAQRGLWLYCPFRYEGRVVPSLGYAGPRANPDSERYVHDEARAKLKSMQKRSLNKCGQDRYCADLSDLGYLDHELVLQGSHAITTYQDFSAALADIDLFYQRLDGRPGPPSIGRDLARLVKPDLLASRIQALTTSQQLEQVRGQIVSLDLNHTLVVVTALREKKAELEIAEARQLNTFAGYQRAFSLSEAAGDLSQMQSLAESPEEKSEVFKHLMANFQRNQTLAALELAEPFAVNEVDKLSVTVGRAQLELIRQAQEKAREEARLAEERKQEAARQVELARQEKVRLAAEKEAAERAAQERCLKDTKCRQAYEERQAQCQRNVLTCRQQCDRAVGSGSYGSFVANLAAAAMARTCYAACTCDGGFGDLLTRFNTVTSDSAATRGAATASADKARAEAVTTQKTYDCKIYCKSASGPMVTRPFQASSQQDAARQAGEQANAICEADGKDRASSEKFRESQCRAR